MRFPWPTLAKLIAFAFASLLVLNIMWNTLNNATRGDTLSYTAQFADASGLRQGDSVRVAGVAVGKVDSIRLEDGKAAVTFRVQADHRLLGNTRILIRYENLIGQRYLSLRPGEGEGSPLPDGSQVPLGRTESAFDLSVLMNGFDPLFDVISPEDVNRLATTIVQVLQGEGSTLNDLLRQIGTFAGDLADNDEVIGRVITNLAQVVQTLAARDNEFSDLLVQTRGLVTGLADNRAAIGSSIESMSGLADALTSVLRDTRPALKSDLRRAERAIGIYARDREQVSRVLSSTSGFVDRISGFAQYGSWADLYPCRLSVLGLDPDNPLYTLLLGDQQSEVCR